MEFTNLTNCHGHWNRINKLTRLYLSGGYTGNRYPHFCYPIGGIVITLYLIT